MGKYLQFRYLLPCLACWLAGAVPHAAEEVYLSPEAFIEQSFQGQPEAKVLWLTRETKAGIETILGHPYKGLRIRYWQSGDGTVWILDEIGKVEPITAGFLVEAGVLKSVQVLIYRESHGWEVRYPFFTDQFTGLSLDEKRRLNKHIDGISGATLSVNALERLARLALHLHAEVTR